MMNTVLSIRPGYAAWPPAHAVSGGCIALCLALICGCATDRSGRALNVSEAIRVDLAPVDAARPGQPVAVPSRISDALAEPVPPAVALPAEPKLDLLVSNAQAREVFLAIVADTRYSMMMHPEVAGTLSVTLRGVTVQEALEAIRDVYGYDFKMEGRRITVYAPTLQTRIFTINYPLSQRVGNSELRVSSGSSMQSSSSSSTSASTAGSSQQGEGSRVTTTSKTDFWAELAAAVKGLVGSGTGRNVITSPQAGIMAVRAMPEELRQVDKFLKAAQIAVERQVMLEAKVVEVQLRDGFQSGIDWSALKNGGNSTGAFGVMGNTPTSNILISGTQTNLPGFTVGARMPDAVSMPSAGSGLFGLAFAREGFQAVLGFLETQGDVQILSSPRIATLNNQKAVLKVGVEESYVTNMTPGVAQTGTTSATLPTPTLSPIFSGISLDVTPQIDEGSNIMLHVHPSVTRVTEVNKNISNQSQPMASVSLNETDTLVRVQDGNIVAIGGLMEIESNRSSSGFPGASSGSFFSNLLGNRSNTGRKKEVVVLIKPTIIRSAQDWEAQTRRTRAALDDIDAIRSRVIRIDGKVQQGATATPVQ